jgi:predicted kinase
LPGTGKTTTASGLGDRLGWTVLSSDALRHQMGLPDDRTSTYREGLYRPEMTAAVYRTLLEEAGECLQSGESVIVDASWTDSFWRRQAATLAKRHAAELVEMACVAPPLLAERRIQSRVSGVAGISGAISDATPSVARQMAADADPWPTAHQIASNRGPRVALLSALTIACPDWADDLLAPASG